MRRKGLLEGFTTTELDDLFMALFSTEIHTRGKTAWVKHRAEIMAQTRFF